MSFVLIEGGEVFAPEPAGPRSLLIAGGLIAKVGAVDRRAVEALDVGCEVLDAAGCLVVPGFIDPHQHITGAAGEEGFGSRAPAVTVAELVEAGITTVVGLLGTDTTTRSLPGLLGQARQLAAQGVTAHIYTGGFPVPPPTITGSVTDDIVIVNEVIGVGEIAIADARAAEPSAAELARLVSAAHVGGLISGKAGVTHFHTGPGKGRLALLGRLLDEFEIPACCLYPTHITRSRALMDDAIALARRGAFVDIDTVEEDTLDWVRYYAEHGGDLGQLTASSDAHTAGGEPRKLFEAFVACARESRLPLERALSVFTRNPAAALKLARKGRLAAGLDGDALVLRRDSLELTHVVARGRVLLRDGQAQVGDTPA